MAVKNKGIFKAHDKIWVEKYRPNDLSEYLGNKEIKEKFKTFIDKSEINNLMLIGSPGLGKSSFANIIVKHFDCDFKYINMSNERGIDTVRTTIMQFCTSGGFAPLKIMVLDEADSLTLESQFALKAVCEQYTNHVRFIFTANEEERIIEALKSRCQVFNFIPAEKHEYYKKCEYILNNEKVVFDKEEVESIIDFNYPDLRKTITSLEQQTIDGVLKLNKDYFRILTYNKKIVEIFKSLTPNNLFDKVTEIRQILADSRVKNYTQLYRHLYDKLDDYVPKEKRVRVICQIQEGLKYDPFIADKEINVISTLLRVAEALIS
jgi:replication factor C small subunit